ncbi:solute carrier family 22 member 5-like [Daphnia pulicaria]|uniref:solute carrier family 22 member 5-like n=1 Tax=Daphnia pulicaria TaxID=35523 RepID=UPI001EEBFA7D|nr:solute carrier family 22 member 5-like [Daphnia pulicaria]XP_046636174.1 solute carrier family 22 member 5-like [Daphnia pulicaria]XP_046636183.1 solute carrier family 22 member 5-like [Daphnia pulicaria]XP_046636191.1 solute carrier family 22 member 5-like [Daphnia pulicaria]XP_046636201.1 solute carrier family 22 member 5-like [Daphnia pulicaria]
MAIEDFDDILPHIGSFGPFQKRILLLSLPVNYFLAVVYMAQIYQTLTPEHWCSVPELSHLEPSERRNLSIPLETRDGELVYSRCRMFDVNFTQEGATVDVTQGRNLSWPTKPCSAVDGWDYDLSGGMYHTIVSESNWVCEDDWRANFAQAMFFAGAIVGSLLFGLLADWYGRLPVLVLSNVLACVAGVATGFCRGFVDFVVCRFLVGMAYDLHYMMMYIILMEYVSPEKRTIVGNIPLAVFLTLGAGSLPWIAYALADWRLFSIVTSAPIGAIVVAWWLVPESARWLVLKGKTDKTMETLRKCARINNKTVDPSVYEEFQAATKRTYQLEKDNPTNWMDLFRSSKMRQRFLIITLTWMVITVVYDGYVRSLAILPYSVFITNSVAGALELPADLVPVVTLDRLGRRWTLMMALGLAGLAGIATGLVPQSSAMLMTLLAMASRFFITIAMNTGLQYTVELIPTQLRGQGTGVVHITGHGATFFAPFILYLSTYYKTLPYIVLGALSVFGGLVCLLLPETANQNLPESVADAEHFGADQSFFQMPCLSKRRERQQRLNDVEDVAVVKRSLPSFGSAAVGGRIASPARQYVKDLSDPMFTGIGSAKLDRQQQQQTVPRRQEEHQPADGWQNEAFATDDISWEKLQTTRL